MRLGGACTRRGLDLGSWLCMLGHPCDSLKWELRALTVVAGIANSVAAPADSEVGSEVLFEVDVYVVV